MRHVSADDIPNEIYNILVEELDEEACAHWWAKEKSITGDPPKVLWEQGEQGVVREMAYRAVGFPY